MKFLVLFCVIAVTSAAPQPRKVFHEHFNDFLDLIMDESQDNVKHLFEEYMEFEEFRNTMDYLTTQNFRDIIYELESLPEFKAVIDFLENDNIDITYFVDMFNDVIENMNLDKRISEVKTRHALSGTDFYSFTKDSIAEFPKEKLAALFEEKQATDEAFRVAIENLNSEEWELIFGALWENETFLKEVQMLEENGVMLDILLTEIMAIFGQN